MQSMNTACLIGTHLTPRFGGVLAYIITSHQRPHRLRVPIRRSALDLIMAFRASTSSARPRPTRPRLSKTSAGSRSVTLGLLVGALTFFAGDAAIDRFGGQNRKASSGEQASGAALAIVLGIILDGIPESIVLGLSVIGGAASAWPCLPPCSCRTFRRRSPRLQVGGRRLASEAAHRTMAAGRAGKRSCLASWLRVSGRRIAAYDRLRKRLRRRRNSDDARRHDDARGIQARGNSLDCSQPSASSPPSSSQR